MRSVPYFIIRVALYLKIQNVQHEFIRAIAIMYAIIEG